MCRVITSGNATHKQPGCGGVDKETHQKKFLPRIKKQLKLTKIHQRVVINHCGKLKQTNKN